MPTLNVHISQEDLDRLESLRERYGFSTLEVAASEALHLALPAIEQAEQLNDAEASSDGPSSHVQELDPKNPNR